MLAADALLTIITWLPEEIYYFLMVEGMAPQTTLQNISLRVAFQGLSLTNVFSTPIVYFIFNSGFRVSIVNLSLA